MEMRSLASSACRALFRYQARSVPTLCQNPLIYKSHSVRNSTPVSISIAISRYLHRSLSTSPPSSAASSTTAVKQDQQQQQSDQPQQQKKEPQTLQSSGGKSAVDKLKDVSDLLNNLGFGVSPRNQINDADTRFGNDFNNLIQRSQQKRQPAGSGMVDTLRALSQSEIEAAKTGPELRLTPSLGRTFSVRNGELAVALAKLNARVRRNQLPSDKRKQRYHVRRGQLKKQLRSERWRKLFKQAFKATVERCEKLRRQGW
ncbi:hypothetical protein VTO42DRAFT_8494 [Malbranchea cinnamomea]